MRHSLASVTDKIIVRIRPAEDAFQQDVLRAIFQISVWCQSHAPDLKKILRFIDGWQEKMESLEHQDYEKECVVTLLNTAVTYTGIW